MQLLILLLPVYKPPHVSVWSYMRDMSLLLSKCRWIQKCSVSIDGIPNYEIPERFVEEEFKLLDDDENEDEDASENDEFDLLTDQEIPLVVEPSL